MRTTLHLNPNMNHERFHTDRQNAHQRHPADDFNAINPKMNHERFHTDRQNARQRHPADDLTPEIVNYAMAKVFLHDTNNPLFQYVMEIEQLCMLDRDSALIRLD